MIFLLTYIFPTQYFLPRHPPRPRASKTTPLISEGSTSSGVKITPPLMEDNCSDSGPGPSPGSSVKQSAVMRDQQGDDDEEEDDDDGGNEEESGGDNDNESIDNSADDNSVDDNSSAEEDDDEDNDYDEDNDCDENNGAPDGSRGSDEESVALIVALGGMGKCLVALQRCSRDIQVSYKITRQQLFRPHYDRTCNKPALTHPLTHAQYTH